jgi:LmbE family N-acetylglucosaminyl deacetylase
MEPLRLLIFGAHPDDPEFRAGGLAAMYRDLGHVVKMISVTNGDAGHHELSGPALATRRRAEAAAAAALIGAEHAVWAHRDGQLQPTLELRWQVIREMRTFKPDLVLTHRPDDYHPDHRAVGHVVRDACYLVTVPPIVPEVPPLRRDPVVGYLCDRFTKPAPLQPDVILDVGPKLDVILAMLGCHASQMFEWLPHNEGRGEPVPPDEAGRRRWLREFYRRHAGPLADHWRARVLEVYGPERGRAVEWVEVFEISEYAAPLDAAARRRLFPLLP